MRGVPSVKIERSPYPAASGALEAQRGRPADEPPSGATDRFVGSSDGVRAVGAVMPEERSSQSRQVAGAGAAGAAAQEAGATAALDAVGWPFLGLLRPGAGETEAKALMEAVVKSPVGFLERRVLVKAASRLGVENVRKLSAAGVRIEIPIDTFCEGGRSFTAEYVPSKKTIRIAPGRLDTDTLVHEMGHALDDVAEPDGEGKAVLRSERSSELEALYEGYCKRVEGLSWWDRLMHNGFWSDYATTSVHEYLADGIMFHTGGDRARGRLAKADPALSAYVGKLLGEGQAPAGGAGSGEIVS